SEADKIAGLDMGADDYITKPFSIKELIARIRVILRRVTSDAFEIYEDHRIRVDVGSMRVIHNGDNITLTRNEFAILVHLIKNKGRVVTREHLFDNIWGANFFGDTRTLDVHIRRLRQKLGDCGSCIETVVGTGYRFIPQNLTE